MESIFLLALIPLSMIFLTIIVPSAKAVRLLAFLLAWAQVAQEISVFRSILFYDISKLVFTPDFAVDRLAALFVILTTTMIACCLTQADFFFSNESARIELRHLKVFYTASAIFLLSMIAVFVSDNLGFLWISMEATTLSSAALVYFDRTKHSIEATWKYVIICSVGIAFALLGTAFVFASSQHGSISHGSLSISTLIEHAEQLNPALLRFGFVFCLLGYGTKAGVFPLHNWLPDAHSEAPAPASAMLSGALLNCALFGIWRVYQLFTPDRRAFPMELMVWMGAITALAASIFLIRQRSFKRMWAFSSIENVGIILIAIGLGSSNLFFLQALNHSVAKVALFLLSGNIIQLCGTKRLNQLRGVLETSPACAGLLLIGTLAVTGLPPFGSFTSEISILNATIRSSFWICAAFVLVALSLSLVAICAHVGGVIFGAPVPITKILHPMKSTLIPALLLAASFGLGLFVGPKTFGNL